jgi:hypothetical protein
VRQSTVEPVDCFAASRAGSLWRSVLEGPVLRLLPLLSLIAAFCGEATAQTRFAAVVGEITDPTDAGVDGARVAARHAATGLDRSATSGRDGHYVLENLPPGVYDITVSQAGMRAVTVKGQELFVGTTTTVNFKLSLGIEEELVVSAATTLLVETTKSEMGQVIQRAEVDELPVVDRTFSSLALLTPTVQQDLKAFGLSIAGQRGFNNNILVDGVTNRSSGLGDQLISFSQDWIDEFRVSTCGYAAEFGNASGGVINVVTRSGANDFHGRAFAYIRDDGLDATPALTQSKAKLSEQRPGGYLSGPIKREKAFFFVGFEYLKSDREAIVTSPLEACLPPARRDPGTGNCLAPAGDDRKLYLAKLDWHPSTTDMVNWRYNREDSSDFNSGVGGLSTVEHGRSSENHYWGIAGAWTRILNGNTTNELRGVFNRAHPQGNVNAGQTYEILRPSGQLGAPVNYGLIGEDWIQFVDNLSLVRGAHTAKFGVSYSNVRYFGNFRNFRDGQYSFTTDRPFNLSDPSTHPLQFVIVEGGTTWDERANLFGAFAQDSWRIGSRVVLNYGIRYDSDDSLTISGAKRVSTVSPRVGVAWSLDRQSKTVVRASGGFFHDSEHTNLANIFILNNMLLDRAVILNWNPAYGGFFNPLYNPQDPIGSAARLRQLLAEAFAQGKTPDLRAISARGLPRSVNGIDSDFTVPEAHGQHGNRGRPRLFEGEVAARVARAKPLAAGDGHRSPLRLEDLCGQPGGRDLSRGGPALRLASAPWLWRSLVHSGEVRGQHVQHARRKHGYQPVRPRRGRGSLRHRHPSYAGAPRRREPTPRVRGVDHTHRAQRPPLFSHDQCAAPLLHAVRTAEPASRRRSLLVGHSRGPEHSDHEADLGEGFP